MTNHITIEDRLEIFAQGGLMNGFTLKLWKSKAKSLEKEGIVLRNPTPTGRKGEMRYDIDFSIPIPGTYSEELYNIARKNRSEESGDSAPAEPLHMPYELD